MTDEIKETPKPPHEILTKFILEKIVETYPYPYIPNPEELERVAREAIKDYMIKKGLLK